MKFHTTSRTYKSQQLFNTILLNKNALTCIIIIIIIIISFTSNLV